MRSYLFIAASVIVLIGAGVAAYFYFFANTASITVAPGGTTTTLPSSGSITPVTTGSGTQTQTPSATPASPTRVSARLVEITAGPVVPGEVVVDVPAANASSTPDTLVKYVERGSGNIYAYSVTSGAITRTSNKTVPGIEKASWLPNGLTTFVQYLSGTDYSTVNTYGLKADGSDGFFLPQDLSDIAVSSTSVLVLASGVNGSAATSYHTDGSTGTEVFTSPLSSLRASFAGKNQYLAFTRPSATLPGDAYLVSSGTFSRIAGPLTGLVALASPSGKWALVSSSSGGTMHMELVNTSTREATALPVATIADKCVWAADDSAVYCGIPVSPSANYAYPDDWYQGAVSFSDRIWKVAVNGRYAQLVLDFPTETKKALDATALAIDPNGQVLTFMNKNDGSLWSYQL